MKIQNKIYVIIVSYNKVNSVIKAVESVMNNDLNIEIILIDNSENIKIFNGLKNKLEIYNNIFFINNKTNLGFSKAVNQGIKIAIENKTDYILLLNDDAYLDKNCLPLLINALEKDKKALLAGPTIFYEKYPNKVWHTGGYFNKLTMGIDIPYKNKTVDFSFFKILQPKKVDFLTGCVLLLKKEAIEKVGFFDENLFFYGEDLDYSLRVKKAGFELLWVPNAFAWHDIDIIKYRTTPFVLYNLAKSNVLVRKKLFDRSLFYYYLVLHFFLYTPFRIYQILRGSKNFESIKAWIKGTIEGLKND
ncbi:MULTISPECIES: glycosyltransferase family 2 protein [Thermodesulfobacterium]|uniref:Glycosyltransferase 2-like domain-containing protein n=1 Tax=Thermodesulfobacterium commune DSM 2178 TaxID=289377 RepID=A0A075X059_9BACT|nr:MULTISPECIES: glycosyltransferase family 2 protein [Thermodesulfobacterium]AIH04367.1 hypothetical protein HL41_06295 [Thermodesulfobacterium commune DSM 2178]MDI3501208.1 hypothetical protein [Thermoanaerobacter sp.]MDK2887008.1 hypothetical protein [Thermosipho sp. (in: thermotogales)]